MVEFNIKVNPGGQYYFPKPVRDSLGDELILIPNSVSALIYSKGTNLDAVLRSARIILQIIEMKRDQLKKNGDAQNE